MTFLLATQPALRVLVLGGTGFIGRHVARALHAAGAEISIGSRRPERHVHDATHKSDRSATHSNTRAFTALQTVRFEQLLQPAAWLPLLQSMDVVVNCVGILRQRPGESYAAVHHLAPAALAAACAQQGVRLVHTSALALHEGARSGFLSSKLLGEHAIAASGADYCIVRPSLLDGEGGFGARWLRGLARSPVQFIPRGATGRIAAMTADDLGHAMVALLALPSWQLHRTVELGGVRHYGYAEYLRHLRTGYTATPALQISLPNWMTRMGAHLCDLFHFSPFSYGHWILLQRDNVPSPNHLPQLLGRAPKEVAALE